ncbi:hypothetical protein FOZ63_032544 [Perkinsus olseni]|uniref:Uncharacterized protein n=1 Tax=Perkinsus olseni TaxID=32597 RepID=A0A7J6QQM6_PEROL|nr:hypothetical protein FOZ62_028988 [Perkinsus olseni]KAF4730723.1 hypothetical protein FOZ63_032544 [Perkinsus olseni]
MPSSIVPYSEGRLRLFYDTVVDKVDNPQNSMNLVSLRDVGESSDEGPASKVKAHLALYETLRPTDGGGDGHVPDGNVIGDVVDHFIAVDKLIHQFEDSQPIADDGMGAAHSHRSHKRSATTGAFRTRGTVPRKSPNITKPRPATPAFHQPPTSSADVTTLACPYWPSSSTQRRPALKEPARMKLILSCAAFCWLRSAASCIWRR